MLFGVQRWCFSSIPRVDSPKNLIMVSCARLPFSKKTQLQSWRSTCSDGSWVWVKTCQNPPSRTQLSPGFKESLQEGGLNHVETVPLKMKLNFPSHIAFWDLGWNMILQYAPPIPATHVPSFPHFGHAARTAKRCTARSTRSTPSAVASAVAKRRWKTWSACSVSTRWVPGTTGIFLGEMMEHIYILWNIYFWQGFRILELFGRIWNMSSQTWTDSFRHFSSCLGLRIC